MLGPQRRGRTASGGARGLSRWRERSAVAIAAAAGLALSVYLAAYQLGAVAAPWDPLFGPASSARVLHSALSRALPLPDAAAGAIGYAAELAADLAGGRDRWRTHPWLVLAFGAIVAALALVGATLVVVQAAIVRAGCTLCLCSALLSIGVAIAVAAGGEVQAAFRVARAAHEGRAESWR
ncbi:MAG TPA: vitamin K epoxide reductase family protein [Anaeromyxobacter sp.]